MPLTRIPWQTGLVLLTTVFGGNATMAQTVHWSSRPLAANVIVPQSRAFTTGPTSPVQITDVAAGVSIVEQVATTCLDISLRNPAPARTEAELIVPVPDGAVVRGFTFEGGGSEPSAEVLPKDQARQAYDAIVAKLRDPALLEFVGCNLIRSSVFPVPPNGTQKVRLTYEHLLAADGNRVDYVLPRSESLDYSVPWSVTVSIKSKQPIATVYSPSHAVETTRPAPGVVTARINDEARTEPGSFRLSYLIQRDEVTASLIAYPDGKVGGGYFLLLAGLPPHPASTGAQPAIKREVTIVLDRSGSMSGQKIKQVRQAAIQIIGGLEPGEAFNLLTYNDTVNLFSNEPMVKTPHSLQKATNYLEQIQAGGGTNIHDALTEALRLKPLGDVLPIVLFLTDGLPTVGQTSEVAIRDVAEKANPYQRRIFTFGVGVDVNTPLLTKIASDTRATATFVLPAEDVEVKVAQVFKRLSGPVLADARLEINPGGDVSRVCDVMPATLPDLFEGDQLVVLGQYTGDDPLTFRVGGSYLGRKRVFEFTFGLQNATTRNAFVPRLWASRKIGVLSDAIRQLGAGHGAGSAAHAPTDPRLKELIDEIVRLSTEFGILTEYTAFLAKEGTNLSNTAELLATAGDNFRQRAISVRSGLAAVNQELNNSHQIRQTLLNGRNSLWDANMNRVAVTTVQQVNDRAFYQRNGRWIDSRLVNQENTVQPEQVIEFGSPEFRDLARRLAEEGRQGTIALRGDVLMLVDARPVLIKAPTAP